MINIGDIVEYIDPDVAAMIALRGFVKEHDLFFVKRVERAQLRGEPEVYLVGINVLSKFGYEYNPCYMYNYRFKLIAKKTDFGYVFVI